MIMAQSKETGLDAASRPAAMIQYGPGASWRPSREKPTVSLAGVRGSGMRAVSLRRWQGTGRRRRQIVEVSGGHTAAVLLLLLCGATGRCTPVLGATVLCARALLLLLESKSHWPAAAGLCHRVRPMHMSHGRFSHVCSCRRTRHRATASKVVDTEARQGVGLLQQRVSCTHCKGGPMWGRRGGGVVHHQGRARVLEGCLKGA